jgi:hypothetical protein
MAPKSAVPIEVPAFTRWALRIGGGAALVCGAILSFFALYGLAVMNGWPRYIAWALPGSVDVLTATAAVVAMSVPRAHRGASIAHWSAAASLLITVGCNVEFHALLPATRWSIGHVFLVATGAVPAIVVELILVMQMYLGDGAVLAGADHAPVVQPKAQSSKNGAVGQSSKSAAADRVDGQSSTAAPVEVVHADDLPAVQNAPSSTRTMDEDSSNQAATDEQDELIVQIGRTVYEAVKTELGKRPPQQAFCDALAAAAAPHVDAGRLPETYRSPSISTAKRVRKDVEDRFPGLSPLHLIRAAS